MNISQYDKFSGKYNAPYIYYKGFCMELEEIDKEDIEGVTFAFRDDMAYVIRVRSFLIKELVQHFQDYIDYHLKANNLE